MEAREMAYDDSAYRRRDTEPGRPEDAEYRPASYEPDYREPDTLNETLSNGQQSSRRVPPAVLDDVFDDPMHGEPGRDRMAVHAVWEIVLLLGAAGVAFLLYRREPDALRGDPLNALLVSATALGLLTLGAGVTLRTGAVNLAIGPVAVAAALHYAENGDRGLVHGFGLPLAAGAVGGLVLALVVVGLHVPGWAASLAAALAVIVYVQQRGAPVDVQGDFDPIPRALYLFGGLAALAILGGLLGAIKSVRRTVGRFRPVSDPARRRGGLAAALTGGAIVLSTVFAVAAGLLLATGRTGPVVPAPGLELTGLGVGAALLGGTSAFGRRGGVFGSLLAVGLLTVFIRYAAETDWRIAQLAIAAATIAGGLAVTRLVEHFGRPAAARREADWNTGPSGAETMPPAWTSAQRPESWSSTLPAQPAGGRADPWDSDRWGTSAR
jgi:ribose/xylose/arabinose/galactoside ABC-type transport system permease subunit